MKKKLPKSKPPALTYEDNRACPHCLEKIADQEHQRRVFCPAEYDESGAVIKDCKTAFHDKKNKEKYAGQQRFLEELRQYEERIIRMLRLKGNEVTTADLEAFEIPLNRAMKFEIEPNGFMKTFYLNHMIASNPINKRHKIVRYEQL